MVAEAALAFWLLARNRNRLENYERTLPLDVLTWTDAQPQHLRPLHPLPNRRRNAPFPTPSRTWNTCAKPASPKAPLKRNAELQLEKLQFQMACKPNASTSPPPKANWTAKSTKPTTPPRRSVRTAKTSQSHVVFFFLHQKEERHLRRSRTMAGDHGHRRRNDNRIHPHQRRTTGRTQKERHHSEAGLPPHELPQRHSARIRLDQPPRRPKPARKRKPANGANPAPATSTPEPASSA